MDSKDKIIVVMMGIVLTISSISTILYQRATTKAYEDYLATQKES